MQGWTVIIVAVAYATLLFVIASLGDRSAARVRTDRFRPLIYPLSLAIYCTSWTFFGSVGLATERGFEFLAIYIGPILLFLFGFPLIRTIVTLAKAERITSVADFLGARYGKSSLVAAIATLIATIGAVPYIALQLKSISGSVSLMVEHHTGQPPSFDPFVSDISLGVAMILALFAILFGTRHADATEHQDGLVLAVAAESIVKLAAFLAIGIAVVFLLFGSPAGLVTQLAEAPEVRAALGYRTSIGTWIVVGTLATFAVILLPRQFHVAIVENRSENELRKASWVFPLYLVAINIFVLPIAFCGLVMVGDRTSADLYVLSIPLLSGYDQFATVAFIGGLSAATAMVIVETVALSIMISNDLVIPFVLRGALKRPEGGIGDWSALILNIRRASIFVLLFAAFLYYRASTDSARLAAIGLMSFAAIGQFAPAFFGGLIWRRGNARGAALGMTAGILTWAYTLLLPSFLDPGSPLMTDGAFGIAALRPQALFGTEATPLNHGVLWSLAINTLFFVLGSLSRAAVPLERIQAAIFVPREPGPMPNLRRFRTTVTVNDLKDTIARYLGVERTERSFESFQAEGERPLTGNEPAGVDVIRFSEQLLASAVGSSSARLVLSLLFKRNDQSPREALKLLDDATEALHHNRGLLQIALDQMEQGITVFDRDFRLTCWNHQYRALLGLADGFGQVGVSLDRILGDLVARGEIPEQERVPVLNRFEAFGNPWQLELGRSGRILELRSNPMPDGGLVVTYADISAQAAADLALKRANESLEQRVRSRTVELVRVNEQLAKAHLAAEQANLGKTRFLAAAGHDILQPLNAARLYCASLVEKVGPGQLQNSVSNIESALESVEHILGAILDISRLDAGALRPTNSTFHLGELLRQMATDFQPLAAGKKLDFRVVPSSLAVHTDRNLLRRLVQNLISNAIKYTPEGRVLVGVRRRGAFAEIHVLDTGIGIAHDKLDLVFKEFTRLEDGAREAEGLGLGLSIVDRIARVLGVEIGIASPSGKGTRFCVRLPVTDMAEAPAIETSQPGVPASVALDGVVVYCIDNDALILDGMRQLLEGWGCVVRTFCGSREIDSAGATLPFPDIVLVDYHLDGETGLGAIARLRTRFGPATAAVLVTADRSSEVRQAAEAAEVPVLNKPVKPAMLRAVLTRLRRVRAAAE